jgi:hypothetical protein
MVETPSSLTTPEREYSLASNKRFREFSLNTLNAQAIEKWVNLPFREIMLDSGNRKE